jgi:hypothetical protein
MGMRLDPDEAFDDSKLTGFGCFRPSVKASDWIADRLAEGPTGIGAWGFDYSALVSSTALALRNHSLTFIKADVSMRRIVDKKSYASH